MTPRWNSELRPVITLFMALANNASHQTLNQVQVAALVYEGDVIILQRFKNY